MPLRALVCCCVLAALFGLGGAPVASAQGSVLRVGLSQLPATLDPALAVNGSAAIVARHVFDRLFHHREGSSDVEPGLALQWSVARDGLAWTIRLREGVRFHDGTPLTAQHVAASLERLLFPGHPPRPPGGVAPAPRAGRRWARAGSPWTPTPSTGAARRERAGWSSASTRTSSNARPNSTRPRSLS